MFRTQAQQARVCMVLTRMIPGSWFTEEGPTEAACKPRKYGVLSSGERTMLELAFVIWNGRGLTTSFPLRRLMILDNQNLRLVGTLFVAIAAGGTAIDLWLDQHRAPAPYPVSDEG